MEEIKITASEALYGFCGWLTTRKERIVMSTEDDAAPIPPLIDQFCKANGLPDPRDEWTEKLVHPSLNE